MPSDPKPHADPLMLYLIRHGETKWSLSGRHTGRTNIALKAHGEDQARRRYRDGCPGGEDASQVSDRADRLIAKLQALRGNIALFSHGQFACSFAARWIGSPVSQGQHLMLGTASLSVLGCNPSHPDIQVIVHWNASGSPERPNRALCA
jgi:broad specificity phosphatase PhoE